MPVLWTVLVSVFGLLSHAATFGGGEGHVWPYDCRQLEAMENTPEVLCRLVEQGDAPEVQKRIEARPELANADCSVNASYYSKKIRTNSLFTLALDARQFWDSEDLNTFRARHARAECHPERFRYLVEELEATGLYLSTVVDPNSRQRGGTIVAPRSNIESLCDFSRASGNQYIPHSRALDKMEENLFARGAGFHGYCGSDPRPHP